MAMGLSLLFPGSSGRTSGKQLTVTKGQRSVKPVRWKFIWFARAFTVADAKSGQKNRKQLRRWFPFLSMHPFICRKGRYAISSTTHMERRKQLYAIARFAVIAGLVALLVCATVSVLCAQVGTGPSLRLESGEQIYKAACVACHGSDGKGMPKSISGFEPPRTFPDFTQCDQTTPEENPAWKAVITHGGPYRGFSQIMPSFGEALTSEQIDQVVKHLRSFCRNPRWPRGELNLPRAMVTEKAYPEDEVVISTALNAQGSPSLETHIIHEQRFGINNQIEVDVPVSFQDQNRTWYGGVGDTTLGVKRVMFSNLQSGSIFSLQGSVLLPSGNKARGFGSGTTTFETFAAYDQLFRTNTFVQTQFGADLPRHTDIAPQSIFFNTALGQSFAADRGSGRLWSPMVEFLASRDLADGAKTNWDVLPQMQVTISRRQHIRGDLGVRVPVNNTPGRPIQLMFYLLWDWQDGRLNEGW
jgi:mono/diheme cytochrome c family protein